MRKGWMTAEEIAFVKNRMLDLRTARGFTQQQAADMAGIERSTWGNYETGVSSPSKATLAAIAQALNTTPKYLMGKTNNKLSNTLSIDSTKLSIDNQNAIQKYPSLTATDRQVIDYLINRLAGLSQRE